MYIRSSLRRFTRFPFVALAAFGLILLPAARAQIATLTDQNSIVQINTGNQMGMFSWNVEGQPQLFQQWFWYRIGGLGPEYSIDTISPPVLSLTPSTLSTTYTTSNFNVNVVYSLQGGPVGSGVADMTEQITIVNTSGGVLDFHFFQYSDFDLGGTIGGQYSALTKNNNLLSPNYGKYIEADQVNGLLTISETVTTPGADHGEAGLYPNTVNRLNDGVATTLNDNPTAGPGDATWALEWDLSLAASGPGSAAIISKDKHLTLVVIPEPSSIAMLALGVAAVIAGRRRQTA